MKWVIRSNKWYFKRKKVIYYTLWRGFDMNNLWAFTFRINITLHQNTLKKSQVINVLYVFSQFQLLYYHSYCKTTNDFLCKLITKYSLQWRNNNLYNEIMLIKLINLFHEFDIKCLLFIYFILFFYYIDTDN